MKNVRWGLSVLLAVFLVFMGSQKFGDANPVFSYIAEMSGIALFEPVIRTMVGIAEMAAAILILLSTFSGRLRGVGALVSTALIAGALGFHLSPWLGINAPVAFTTDGGYEFSPMLFGMAVAFFLISVVLVWMDREALMRVVQRRPD